MGNRQGLCRGATNSILSSAYDSQTLPKGASLRQINDEQIVGRNPQYFVVLIAAELRGHSDKSNVDEIQSPKKKREKEKQTKKNKERSKGRRRERSN